MKRDSINGMQSAIYDPNVDGSVIKADAVRAVDDLPAVPLVGEIVSNVGKLYVGKNE
jgi:hypothetical protein